MKMKFMRKQKRRFLKFSKKRKKKGSNKPRNMKKFLFEQQKGICKLCGQGMSYEDANLDHIKPKSRGGSSRIGNLQATHKICNGYKGNLNIYQFRETIIKIMRKKGLIK